MQTSIEKRVQQPYWLEPYPVIFPPTKLALTDPDGLLAIGGDLTSEWLIAAYRKGIFPWFNENEPILWWTPNPRSVLFIKDLIVRKSLKKTLRKKKFTVTLDTAFTDVMKNCAKISRPDQDGTWISEEMLNAYQNLHNDGYAHSVEVWQKNELVGGLYGIAIGKMFFGESMFAKTSDASKVALVALCEQLKEWGFEVIDTQVETSHLKSLGARLVNRAKFEYLLEKNTLKPFPPKKWQLNNHWDYRYLSPKSCK